MFTTMLLSVFAPNKMKGRVGIISDTCTELQFECIYYYYYYTQQMTGVEGERKKKTDTV